MLIQFVVENYRSFRDRTVFSMRAARNVERGADAPDVVQNTEILRCAALYGANASGKSNFVKALKFVRDLVHRGSGEKARIRTQPFRLDPDVGEAPSRFELYLRAASGRIYGYGFLVRPDSVTAEWLAEVDGDEREVFRREGKNFEFASDLSPDARELLTLVSSSTRDDQLLVRTAQELKLERFPRAFKEVVGWFEELNIIEADAKYADLIAEAHRHEAFRAFLGGVLDRADTGIRELGTVKSPVSASERSELEELFSPETRKLGVTLQDGKLRAHFEEGGDDWYRVELRLGHGAGPNRQVDFTLDEESDGTVRLLDLAPLLFFARRRPSVFVVDELDRSMHTALTRWLVEHFISDGAGAASQLIFTTHDTNLLDLELLRADAIWFAEKDESGASNLYSLAEFKKEQLDQLRGALEQGYLNGRFGAIPFLRELADRSSSQESEG